MLLCEECVAKVRELDMVIWESEGEMLRVLRA